MSDLNVTVQRETLQVELTGAQFVQSSLETRTLQVDLSANQLPSAASTPTISGIAAEPISALRAIRSANDGIRHASSTQAGVCVLGITLSGANAGSSVTIQTTGEITDSNWNWTTEGRVFLGANGALTQTPSPTGMHVLIGIALSPNRIWIRIEDGIKLEV